MKLVSFEAQNFKGIEDVKVQLSPTSENHVYCFVGLNESGKTTLLEALNAFKGWTETLKPVTSEAIAKEVNSYIPKSSISNFTGNISIVIECSLDDDDKKAAVAAAKKHGVVVTSVGDTLVKLQHYKFEDSVHTGDVNQFKFEILGHGAKSRKKNPHDIELAVKQAVLEELDSRLPAVLYFPNALFDTPDQINLSTDGSASEKDLYYQQVLQDALDSLQEKNPLKLQAHITARIGVASQEEALENTVRKLEGKISKIVFTAWKEILGVDLTSKKITLKATKDGENPVLRISYTDGADSYKISERSLGFRWFFGFLLLTQFRRQRLDDRRQVLYVFDEPASNLHSSAQKKLLETFGHLAKQSPVLYSTHSHHLINPDWLENAFVVKNSGLTYDATDFGYTSRSASTKIEVRRYRSFVARHKNQTTYYQPILDVLDYQPSHLELVPSAVMVEGKNDYYSLRLLQLQSGFQRDLVAVKLIPGNGSGGLDPVIQLYSGWGASFQILLDSDTAGSKEKTRYVKKFGQLVDERLNLLGDTIPKFSGSMESMFSETDKREIAKATGQTGKTIDKIILNKCIQECVARKLKVSLEPATIDRFKTVLGALKAKLDAESKP